MEASGLLKWLKGSLSSPENESGRTIMRFVHPGDDHRFFQALQSQRQSCKALRSVRRLGIIRAYSCPVPIEQLPRKLAKSIVWEKDAIVRVDGIPETSSRFRTENGIPWGVRRIGAPDAWNRATGYRVKVGVIDTGVDFQHPDLRHSLEQGINLLQRAFLPYDDNGHGTHIAGTIAAANQLQGMMGVAPRASIYPVKAFDYNGTAYVSDIILGIDWCVRNRMNVVNMSFGMPERSRSLLQAVTNAYRSGVLIVASSGNEGKRGKIDYPARYSQTIAVGATNRNGKVASFTNRSSYIDIYAPGEKIESCWLNGKRKTMSGTSMATSHVTGAVALLLSYRRDLTPDQVKAVLKASARPLRKAKASRSPRSSAGELNAARMLQAADKIRQRAAPPLP